MKEVSLFPVRKMDALPKILARGSSEGKYEWWTKGLEQKGPAAGLITMCLWRDSDRDQKRSLVLRNILFTMKLCHFFQLGHIQRWVADDTSKHNDSALNLQSAEKKEILAPPVESVNEPPAAGNQAGLAGGEARRAANVNAGRFCSAGRCEATHCSLCLHADIILFRQKQQQRRGDRGGSLYVLCRHSVVRHQNKEFCSSAISSSLSLTYSMSKLKTDDKNGTVDH